jgi:hypothetical protein
MHAHRQVVLVLGATFVYAATFLAIACGSASAKSPFVYSATVPDADGMQRDVSFKGETDGRLLQGVVMVEGNPMEVTASIGRDGSIVGAVSLYGRPFGTFAATVKPERDVAITYTVNGRSGTSTAPAAVGHDVLRAIAAAETVE